jgi:excinuclease UvrABC nuclease subunit
MFGDWESIQFVENLAKGIPNLPGVYAIVWVRRVRALPIQVEMIYAGKALNLRQKFQEHVSPWRERSKRLRRNGSSWEFWFLKLPRAQLDRVRRDIIRHAEPPGNQLQYREQRKEKDNEYRRGQSQSARR